MASPTRLGPAAAFALGAGAAIASIGLRAALTPLLGGDERFVSMFPAVLLASFYGGVTGGLTCLLVSVIGGWFFFIGPPWSFVLGDHEAASLVALFVSGGAVMIGMIAIRRLLQSLREAHEAEQMLARELQHRVKNNLSVVEALARASARGTDDLGVFLDRFLGRMQSLSAAHVLLSGTEEEGAELDEVVATVLEPFQTPGRLHWSGERLRLNSAQAVALALCLHELATNSVKYGALSDDAGGVEVSWSKTGPDLASIRWQERDGPPVRPPERVGSGLQLLRRGLEAGLPAELRYPSLGLTWAARFHPAG